MLAKGKYHNICAKARREAGAVAALLIILEGNEGNGFSVQSMEPEIQRAIPALLREVAGMIEAENRRRGN